MKAIVLLNGGAGGFAGAACLQRERSVADALSSAGIETDIRAVAGARLQAEAESAAAAAVDVVIAGGGDGTLSTVAGALAGKAMPLGILPLGTLNHFAKDLHIPLDLPGAARVIAAQHISAIDLAEVNGRVFINNSSLGIYPRAVLEREAQRRHHGLSKWTAMTLAVLKTFRRIPLMQVRLETDQEAIMRKTPLVFVGNNRYEFDLLKMGQRAGLNRGELSLYIANVQSRSALLALTVRALMNGLKQARDFETLLTSSCLIESRRHRLHVAVDGEVVTLAPPLNYRIRAGALRVCLPADAEMSTASG